MTASASGEIADRAICWCAFLRGVNTGGSPLKMKDVCQVFENLGLESVQSVLASGNILYKSAQTAAELRPRLEQALSGAFGSPASLHLRDLTTIRRLREACTFQPSSDQHIYLLLADPGYASRLEDAFSDLPAGSSGSIQLLGDNMFWQVEKGKTLDTPFSKKIARAEFRDHLTTRNINTLDKILAKGCP